jgi:hypothetical protein
VLSKMKKNSARVNGTADEIRTGYMERCA